MINMMHTIIFLPVQDVVDQMKQTLTLVESVGSELEVSFATPHITRCNATVPPSLFPLFPYRALYVPFSAFRQFKQDANHAILYLPLVFKVDARQGRKYF